MAVMALRLQLTLERGSPTLRLRFTPRKANAYLHRGMALHLSTTLRSGNLSLQPTQRRRRTRNTLSTLNTTTRLLAGMRNVQFSEMRLSNLSLTEVHLARHGCQELSTDPRT